MPSSPNPTFVIGAFYELPTGQIAHTIGWSGPTARLSYHFDDGGGPRQIAAAACTAWIHHPDLHDFPNARDPRLPYVFDLLWDIKTRSQLVAALRAGEHGDALRQVMRDQHIVLTDAEAAAVDD